MNINNERMKTLELEFEQVVREHKSTIYTVCFMFSKDGDEVNDLFQEVLINLWKGFSSFNGASKVETWIWRVSFSVQSLKNQYLPIIHMGDI